MTSLIKVEGLFSSYIVTHFDIVNSESLVKVIIKILIIKKYEGSRNKQQMSRGNMPQGQPRENEVTFEKNGVKTCMYVCDLTNVKLIVFYSV